MEENANNDAANNVNVENDTQRIGNLPIRVFFFCFATLSQFAHAAFIIIK